MSAACTPRSGLSAEPPHEDVAPALTETLAEWKAVGLDAESACKAGEWQKADLLAARFCELRPEWPKGYELRRRTMKRLGTPVEDIASMLHQGIARCEEHSIGCGRLRKALSELEGELETTAAAPASSLEAPPLNCGEIVVAFKSKVKGVKLLPHEQRLAEMGELEDVTHAGSSAIWLSAPSVALSAGTKSAVYRPMGDLEFAHLAEHGILPGTQPYQTIVEGEEGRVYAEKYLRGHKSVDSSPTTVVEFVAPRALIRELFSMQSKNEDGAISHGLGHKGGRGLPIFNASLQSGETTYRVVFVKRFERRAMGAFGAGRKKL